MTGFIVRLVGCILAVTTMMPTTAFAWEFSMNGSFNFVYEIYSQQGVRGFFGEQNYDRSVGGGGVAAGDFARMNGWIGRPRQAASELVSGTDGAKNYQNLEILPELDVNRAVRFRGKYRLGSYGDPVNSDYITNTRPGTNVALTEAQWTMFWLTAQTPWGVLVAGKRPEAFGTGLQYNGEENNTTEGVTIVAPYGPLRMSLAVRPWWLLQPNADLAQRGYYNNLDKSGVRQLALRFFTTYQNGPVDMGVFWAMMRWHIGPESQVTGAAGRAFNPADTNLNHGTVYLKFNNVRLFFNSELAYWDETNHTLGTRPGPLYRESWRFMTESGLYAGPTKVSLFYAFMPGADRRAGAPINKQTFHSGASCGAYSIFRPYSYLLGYVYGSGVNAYNLNCNGYINEAWVAAARIDYAVAANLNVFGSFLWAERSSHGYPWGFIRLNQTASVTRALNAAGTPIDVITWTPNLAYRQHNGAPNIPDTGLGWEVTAGCQWQILDRYTLSGMAALWKPGKWFNYACVDRGVQGWDNQTDATPFYPFGTHPDRSIDPIIGGEVSLKVDF